MTIDEWAVKWKVPYVALRDLRLQVGAFDTDPNPQVGDSEAAIQARARIEASKRGMRLFRNNNGACMDSNGNFIRYGLANDSKKMNEKCKSSDLIGINPVIITTDMIGRTIGQFVARECKKGSWKYSGTPEEQAQLKFGEVILAHGGDFAFLNK